MKELTQKASSQGNIESLLDYFEKQPNYSDTGHKTGQKLQTTVRFEAPVLQEIEEISETDGIALAEAVRRLVREGLQRQKT